MFRMWGKLTGNNHILRDHIVEVPDANLSRTGKVFHALEQLSRFFDLPVPLWLDGNIRDFQRTSRTRFTQDSFIEPIGFDYMEIQIIEEDEVLT